jgi:hypothetical protein
MTQNTLQPLLDNEADNHSGLGKLYPVPIGVAGWSWGAFCLNWVWAISNRTWIGLFALTPYLGIVVAIILGVKGREWAWQNRRWDSLAHFNRVQRRWSIWGACLLLIPVIGILAAVAIPMYTDYATSKVTNQAYLHANQVAAQIGKYIEDQRRLPDSLAAVSASESVPAGIQHIVFNKQTAQLEITMGEKYIVGKTFYLAPSYESDGHVSWRCLHGDLRQSLLPKQCRYSAADPFWIQPH